MHIYSGLFIKFFEHRKSLRKSKLVTITMFKYLQSILFLSKLRRFIMILKGQVFFINELFLTFSQPLGLKTLNFVKLTKKQRKKPIYSRIRFLYIYLLHNHSFCKQKTKSRGRVKRKIRRRLVRANAFTDS